MAVTDGRPAADRPTGTNTFLFTDVVGSTPLWDAHPDHMAAALERHEVIVKGAIADHGGHVFSTAGDSFAAVFASACAAVNAGLRAQRELRCEPWPGGIVFAVRMGAHTGDAQERDGNYFGPSVNRAARIMGAANGGQLVVSGVTAELVAAGAGAELVDLGATRVKGVVEPIRVFGVSGPGAPWLDVPLESAETSAGNLPRPITDFVGDLADLRQRVAGLAQTRLVTLTGSGGVGKTRAAIEIGWLVLDDFPDGVWMCELAPITDPESVIAAVAAAVGARPQLELAALEAVVDWCHGRRVLLVLDNCEHVLEPVIELVEALISSVPTVTVIATSREPLGVAGERVVRIPSLTTALAVELFVARSAAAGGDLADPSAANAIEAIGARLDGIPLAIELAAARTRSLSPVEILERLDDRFRLLRGGGRGGLERHQTLRATVAWSYQLLAEPGRVLFDRLSVFAGSFDLDAAEAVCGGGEIEVDDVVDLVSDLVDKSMVTAERVEHRTRYRLLETLRQYGEERLDQRDATEVLRDRHLDHCTEAAERVSALLFTDDHERASTFLELEWDNLRAAFGWAITVERLDRVEQLVRVTLGHAATHLHYEHAEWVARGLQLADRLGRPSAVCHGAAACWAVQDGDTARGMSLGERGTGIAGGDIDVALCQIWRAEALAAAGMVDEALAVVPVLRAVAVGQSPLWLRVAAWSAIANFAFAAPSPSSAGLLDAFADFCEQVGSTELRATKFFYEGHVCLYATAPPDADRAIDCYREAARLAGATGNDLLRLWAEAGITFVAVLDGKADVGVAIRQSLADAYAVRKWNLTLGLLEAVQLHLVGTGDLEGAATVAGFVDRRPPPWGRATAREIVAHAVAAEPDATAWRARGAAMDRHDIVGFALGHLPEAHEV